MDLVELISEDGVSMKASRKCLRLSTMLSPMMEMTSKFPLVTVTGPTLRKVVEYLNAHVDDKDEHYIASQPNAPKISPLDDDDSIVRTSSTAQSQAENDDEYKVENIMAGRYRGLLTPFDQRFLASMDVPILIEVTKAANYLGIERLLDLCCRGIASQMRGLSAEGIRQKFGIKNDFTPEEEANLKRYAAWTEDF
jgi:S-phase kinase-associated protein 1